MKKNALKKMKHSLMPGNVYRRNHFATISSNVDRHLKQLVEEGDLQKLSYGLYLAPNTNTFGIAPPNEYSLVETFLNDDHFVIYNPSQFNAFGLGTTQLYNKRVVFNRKRSGTFELANKNYYFYRWREAPKNLTKEFLLVEMINKLDFLVEDQNTVLKKLESSLGQFDRRKLLFSLEHYGTISTQKLLTKMLNNYEQ